jgi:hypothetical protein
VALQASERPAVDGDADRDGIGHFAIGPGRGDHHGDPGWRRRRLSIAVQTSTFSAKTFASLGISPGTYTWSWGSGGSADSLTLVIVPEPASIGLVLAGLAGLGALRRGRHIS